MISGAFFFFFFLGFCFLFLFLFFLRFPFPRFLDFGEGEEFNFRRGGGKGDCFFFICNAWNSRPVERVPRCSNCPAPL